jgi:DNA-binding response OmpR family regulator
MKVLVVDDEEMAVRMVEMQLRAENFDVLTCFDGREAVDIIKEQQPDLVISDIMMPFMSGLELLELIKSENKKIPVILISALDDVEVVQTAIGMGADDFIIKPVNMSELSLRIHRVLVNNNLIKE